MTVEPQKQHQWLHKMIGDWNCEGEAVCEPGKPQVKWKMTETVRSIGGVWVVAEGQGEMPEGGESTSVLTLGYDTAKQRFVGTFIASMMNNLWVYEGTLDESGTVLTLNTEGPSMGAPGGELAPFQDILTIRSDDERTLTSRMQAPDGSWQEFMTMTYTRKK